VDIIKLITDQALILIPPLYVIGKILKSTEIKDKYIPITLLPLGILGSIALMGVNVQSIIQGILVTGATVYTNQLIKQSKKEQ
jgi:Na+/H+ antiporter NhaC